MVALMVTRSCRFIFQSKALKRRFDESYIILLKINSQNAKPSAKLSFES